MYNSKVPNFIPMAGPCNEEEDSSSVGSDQYDSKDVSAPPSYTMSPIEPKRPTVKKHIIVIALIVVITGSVMIYAWLTSNRSPDTSTINAEGQI